ncbi:uncharacterized protein BXZ73DRAFT_84143 [Epithele typhae]|uniref:uncharacterized protein n=1 Tax=Epithele typhae TaxID=378194 RepID=UPI002007A9BA|nr:uncharacterized protein BXZ73DRAFT_84143 [Epithele typhae]KAH9909422.1 hypothetical protein BXZ73DRAFT_84143 [Epithele typhae]
MTIKGLGLKKHTSWAGGQAVCKYFWGKVEKRHLERGKLSICCLGRLSPSRPLGQGTSPLARPLIREDWMGDEGVQPMVPLHLWMLRTMEPGIYAMLFIGRLSTRSAYWRCIDGQVFLSALSSRERQGGKGNSSPCADMELYRVVLTSFLYTLVVSPSGEPALFRAGQLRTWWSDYQYLEPPSNPLNEAVSQPGVARLATLNKAQTLSEAGLATLNGATTKPRLVALNGVVISKARMVTLNSLTLNNVVSKGALVMLNSLTISKPGLVAMNWVAISKPRLELWTDLASQECVSSKPGLVGNYSHRLRQHDKHGCKYYWTTELQQSGLVTSHIIVSPNSMGRVDQSG